MEKLPIKISSFNFLKGSAILFAVFIMFGLFLAVFQARSQIIEGSWTATGLDGESISSIAIDTMNPSSLYARVDRLRYGRPGNSYQCPFYYKSNDKGSNWVLVEEKHESDTMCASQPCMQWLWVDPTDPLTLYIDGSCCRTLDKSIDGGQNWLCTTISGLEGSQSLAIDPTNSFNLYVGASNGCIFKSVDGGWHWIDSNEGLNNLCSLNFGSELLFLDPIDESILYAVTDGNDVFEKPKRIFKSTDSGYSWKASDNGLKQVKISQLVIDPNNHSILYISTLGQGIFKSTDGGSTWIEINDGLDGPFIAYPTLAIDTFNPSILYAGSTGSRVYKSTNGGNSWVGYDVYQFQQENNPSEIKSLIIDPVNSSVLYAGTSNGWIFKSIDAGINWTIIEQFSDLRFLAINPYNPTTLFAGTNFAIAKSTDGGNSWSYIFSTFVLSRMTFDPWNPSTLYAISVHVPQFDPGGVSISTDEGLTWAPTDLGLTDKVITGLYFSPLNPLTVYATTESGLFKSNDRGENWIVLSEEWDVHLAIDQTNADVTYLGMDARSGNIREGVYKTVNNGNSWDQFNAGLTDLNIESITIAPSDNLTLYVVTPNGIFKSIDGASHWELVHDGSAIQNINSLVIDPLKSSTLYISTNVGVFMTIDGGSSWTEKNEGLPDVPILSMAIDPHDGNTLYAGTQNNGIYKFSPPVKTGGGNGSGCFLTTIRN